MAPEWLEVENVDRRAGLTVEEFQQQYESRNIPVIITDAVPQWQAMSKWTMQYLKRQFDGSTVHAGGFEMSFDGYMRYAASHCDELPLYIFDKHFGEKAPQLAHDYTVPPYFSEDLFSVLGEKRPDYRWLIIGPERSGSSFHKDPNETSAWNAVVSGRKKWILYPPHVTPPGVHASEDGANVAAPVSLMEWLLSFYEFTKQGDIQPLECIVNAGEVIFVPRGWWHMVVNLEFSVAVTQNFVSAVNLSHVLRFLSSGSTELVSGCDDVHRATLHDAFVAALEQHRPAVLRTVRENEAQQQHKRQHAAKLAAMFATSKPQQPPCADVVGGTAAQQPSTTQSAGSFSFGFKVAQ